MPQYEKKNVSEGIDTNKGSASKECTYCHYCCFKDVGFKFEPHVCDKCHDVLMTLYESKNIAILKVNGVDFSQCTDILKELLVLLMVIIFSHGNLNYCLRKILQLLLHQIIFLILH